MSAHRYAMATYEEALKKCVEHYMERGYTEAQAMEYVARSEAEVFRVYNIIIEEEKRMPYPPTPERGRALWNI